MNYFILVNNQQQGPFTVDELRTRNITSDTLVWAEGMAQWTPAWQVEELKPLFFDNQAGMATPPPPPPMEPAASNEPTTQDGNQKAQSSKQKPQRKKFYVALAVIVIVLFILALTNPGKAEHRQAIMQKIDTATEQVNNISDPMARAVVSSIMGASQGMMKQVVEELIDSDLEYHNYIFFSTTTLHSDLLEHDIRTSSGFLGHVNAISLTNIIPDIITRQIGIGSDRDNEGNSQEEESTTTTSQDADGNQTTTVSKVLRRNGITVDSLTKKVTNRLADDVAKRVKKEVRQETDSATASGIDAIVNDVLNFIKGL